MRSFLLLLTAVVFTSIATFAQRTVNLQLTLQSPDDGEYIPPMQSFPITISVKNLGSENLGLTDSIAYYLLLNGDTIVFQPQNENQLWFSGSFLAPGDSVSFTRYMGFDASFNGATVELCIFVKPVNAADPVSDPQLVNNKDCAVIFVMNDPAGLTENSGITVTVSPNPVNDLLTIATEQPVASVSMTDASGKQVETSLMNGTTIDCRDLEPGMYFLTVETVAGMAVKQVCIRD